MKFFFLFFKSALGFEAVHTLDFTEIYQKIDFESDFYRIRFLPLANNAKIEINSACNQCKNVMIDLSYQIHGGNVFLSVADTIDLRSTVELKQAKD
jgi:hypothetical protein